MHSSINHTYHIHASNHTYYNSVIQPYMHTSSIQKKHKRNIVHPNKHSIYASFREVNEICKMGNKKVRTRRLEEEEEEEEEEENEEEEEEEVYDIYELT